MRLEVYEVISQSFPDISLPDQIEFCICDWVAIDNEGREFFGMTQNAAIENAKLFHGISN